MTEPRTTLDARFSDPDAVAVSWDETRQVLEDVQLFWIATVRADGRPHVTPLVAVWLDEAIHFTTSPGEQKAINLRSNRHVILVTGSNERDSGLDIVVEGEALQMTGDTMLGHLADAWRLKWDGQWRYEAHDGAFHLPDGGEVLAFAVRPDKVLAFSKGTFGQTRHRF